MIDGSYQQTKFHLVDLAGAERIEKAGGTRMCAMEAFMLLEKGKAPDAGA